MATWRPTSSTAELIKHRFCTTCGIQSLAQGTRPSDGAPMAAINVR